MNRFVPMTNLRELTGTELARVHGGTSWYYYIDANGHGVTVGVPAGQVYVGPGMLIPPFDQTINDHVQPIGYSPYA